MKAGRLREDGTVKEKMDQMLEITVRPFSDFESAELKLIDPIKSVYGYIATDGSIIQYQFPLDNSERKWTLETAQEYINNRTSQVIQCILDGGIEIIPIKQASFVPEETLNALKTVNSDPYFGLIRIKYGLGSGYGDGIPQYFDQAFFQSKGHKFQGTHLLYNHSDINEFGNSRSIGSVVKFLGAKPEGADYGFYLNSSEGQLRQAFQESKALGEYGAKFRPSIEGQPGPGDYIVKQADEISPKPYKHFVDISYPTGIAVVLLAGLKGSQIF
jgi:hypothetical protein